MTTAAIDVSQVRTAYDAKTANELLAEGWVLLNTAAGKDEMGYPLTSFTLGLPKKAS